MRSFRDLPIRHKLLLMTFISTGGALTLAAGGLVALDTAAFRDEIVGDVAAQASIIAENSAAPLAFRDQKAAAETLGALRLRPQVTIGCLYNAGGQLFADYRRDASTACPAEPPPITRFGWERFEAVATVRLEQDRLGTLFIQRELSDLYTRLRVGAFTAGALLLLAIGLAFLIGRRMQRAIATPLLQLADTARQISTSRDYNLRAVPGSRDEIGVVVHAFNDMLDRVAERTAELSHANKELELEVEERRRVEAERTAALERERDANRLKDEFLATLSHELRTPLNAVLGWTRVLRGASVSAATQERALESIERNARAQARLVEDLLEVSRIVTGKLRINVRPVDLAALVDSAVEVVRPAAVAKRITLEVAVDVRPALTAGDPDRLQQVIWNVLSNAVKFTPTGGTVRIRLECFDGYRLTVLDTGAGIDPKFLPHVFDAFRQADGTSSREHGGLGLGLAIAKQLIELHGGTIRAHSRGRGTGATFEIQLPSIVPPQQEEAPRDPLAPPGSLADLPEDGLLRNIRVLVVDDEEDARLLLEATLTQYGAEVRSAASAAEALELLDRGVPDVILSDVGMPHEDGYTLIRRVRSRPAAHGGAVPAVAITAYASAADRRATLAAGYQAHVAKPFEPREVAVLVAQLGRGVT